MPYRRAADTGALTRLLGKTRFLCRNCMWRTPLDSPSQALLLWVKKPKAVFSKGKRAHWTKKSCRSWAALHLLLVGTESWSGLERAGSWLTVTESLQPVGAGHDGCGTHAPAEHPFLGAGVELLEKEPPAGVPWREKEAWPGDSQSRAHLVRVTSASSAKAPMWRPRTRCQISRKKA